MEWIKCNDRLPRINESSAYIFADNEIIDIKQLDYGIWFDSDKKYWMEDNCLGGWAPYEKKVTFWMRIEELKPPKD